MPPKKLGHQYRVESNTYRMHLLRTIAVHDGKIPSTQLRSDTAARRTRENQFDSSMSVLLKQEAVESERLPNHQVSFHITDKGREMLQQAISAGTVQPLRPLVK